MKERKCFHKIDSIHTISSMQYFNYHDTYMYIYFAKSTKYNLATKTKSASLLRILESGKKLMDQVDLVY